MEYTCLGHSGLRVSRIALGCMSFGDSSRGLHQWALDEEAAEPIFRQAIDLSITFWDTANAYGIGTSEEIVGRALKKYTSRENIVLATKVFFKMHDGPGGAGLSRRAIMEQIDASLSRLGTDYVDLYQIHRFDPQTPVEETMEALHDVVKAGKARYLGASSMWAWQFASMQHTADLHGWTRFVSMQDQYSLMQREEEREMFGLLADQGVASIPWSPLARGRLARPWAWWRRIATSERTWKPAQPSWSLTCLQLWPVHCRIEQIRTISARAAARCGLSASRGPPGRGKVAASYQVTLSGRCPGRSSRFSRSSRNDVTWVRLYPPRCHIVAVGQAVPRPDGGT